MARAASTIPFPRFCQKLPDGEDALEVSEASESEDSEDSEALSVESRGPESPSSFALDGLEFPVVMAGSIDVFRSGHPFFQDSFGRRPLSPMPR